MSKITQVFEDLASGRPIKKPVKSNLLKARKDANEKAMKSGFMKMPDYARKKFDEEKEDKFKPHYMYKGDKKVYAKKKEDHDKLNKQGYDHDDPKTKKIEEGKKGLWDNIHARRKKGLPPKKPGQEGYPKTLNIEEKKPKNCGCGQDPCITYGKGGKMEKMNEAKKKGLDGKECWDGYKLQGTKKKGGKTVDNCVKIKEELLGEVSDAVKLRYISKANRDIDNKERASQLADKQGAPASVGKSLSKSTKKRREGVRLARSKLGDVPKKGMSESSSWVQQTADTWNDHADHPHPKVQKHIKAAEKAYNNKDMDAFHHHTNRAADHAYTLRKTKKESWFDTNSWPTHNRHRQRTAARVTADTLNSDKIRKKRNEMHPAARKAYDNKVRDNNNKKYGYHPQVGHKQNKTTPLPKHLHHPKVGLNDSIQMDVYKSLMELSPKTISSYQKKAGAQYRDLKKSTMSATSREGGYHKGYISDKEYDAQHQMADKKARRGKGLAMSAGKGVKKEEVQQVDEISKKLAGRYIKRAVGDAISNADKTQYHTSKMFQKQDAGDNKGAKKEFDKGREPQRKTMNRFYGIQRAAGKLNKGDKDKGEYLGHSMTKQKTSSKVKATEEAQFEESLNKLIGTTVGKIRDAAQQYKKKQDANMKAGKGIYQNPMSGDNIAKRLGPVKKKVAIKGSQIKNKSTY